MGRYVGRINIVNEQGGVNWNCAYCPFKTYNKQITRNHLEVMRIKAKTGEVVLPYYRKERKRIGKLKLRLLGYVGLQCRQVPRKSGPDIWHDIGKQNPRED